MFCLVHFIQPGQWVSWSFSVLPFPCRGLMPRRWAQRDGKALKGILWCRPEPLVTC